MRGLDLTQEPADDRLRGASGLDGDRRARLDAPNGGAEGFGSPADPEVSLCLGTPNFGAVFGFNPPVVTRGSGGSIDDESHGTVEAHFDWYGVTIEARPGRVVDRLATALGADVHPTKPQHGYSEAVELVNACGTVAKVFAGGYNDAPHAVSTGQVSDEFAAAVRKNWPSAQSVARVDSRIDFGGTGSDSSTWDTLYATVTQFASDRDLTTSIHGDYLGSREAGRTLYVGSSKSNVRLRLYEKSKEVRARSRTRNGSIASDWVRVEIQVKPKGAARRSAATASALDVWGYSRWTKDLLTQLTGLDVPRTQITQWRQSDDERTIESLVRQYGPAMRRIAESEGLHSLLARIESAVFAEEPPATESAHRRVDGRVPPQARRLAS